MLRKGDDILGTMLHDVAYRIRLKIDEVLKPFDLTRVSWLAIGIVARQGRLSQSQLAEALELGSPSTGKLVDRLEERGLVERVRDPQDRRSNLLTVTEAARRLLKDLEPVGEDLREEVLHNLTLQEREHLSKMLVLIKERLASTEEAPAV